MALLGRVGSYLRYPVAGVLALLITVVLSLLVVLLGVVFGPDWPVVQRVFRFWGRTLLALFSIHVEVEGFENLPDQGAIFLFNHASDFDIPLICSVLPRPSRFGAKIELFKVPFIGIAMRASGTLPIARGQRDEVLKVYRQSIPRLQAGMSFLLAPEGTRQTEPEIGRFKAGPFHFAIDAGAPLSPVVIEGALDIMPKKSVLIMWGKWSKTVRIRILPPIPTRGLNHDGVAELQAEVREKMIACYQSLRELSSRQR